MNRPKWLRPRVGQNRRRPASKDAEIRREEELRQAQRESAALEPGGRRSFRQEMRAARLRQEEARKRAEEEASARRKVRLEAQAYINGQADSPEPGTETDSPLEEARRARLQRQRNRRLGRKRTPEPEQGTPEGGRIRRRKPKRRLNRAKVALLVASAALLIASYVLLH